MRSLIRTSVALAWVLVPAVLAAQVTTLTESFNGSGGVALHPSGDPIVANFGTTLSGGGGTEVWRISASDGALSLYATGLNGASGNAFDAQGNLYQSNISAGSVSKITPDGSVTTFSTGHSSPVGITIDGDGNLFVANCGDRTIRRVTPQGSMTTYFSGNLLSCPNGITIDEAGNLYVSNFNNGRVLKIDTNQVLTSLAFLPGNNNGHLTYLDGSLYVVARGAHQIYKVTLTGDVTLVAGTGVRGKDDGLLLEASFSIPNGIAASANGRFLYVNDAVPVTGGVLNPVVLRVLDLVGGGVSTVRTNFGSFKYRYGREP